MCVYLCSEGAESQGYVALDEQQGVAAGVENYTVHTAQTVFKNCKTLSPALSFIPRWEIQSFPARVHFNSF